jgi:hypothetical protein
MAMSLGEYTKEKLWQLLVETVHSLVMYPTHKAYSRDNIIPLNADISPNDLASRLNLSLGEALVILSELSEERKCKT